MTTNILMVGNNEQQTNYWVKLLDKNNDWEVVHALTYEEAIEKFHQFNFDVVVLGKDITVEQIKKLNKLFTLQHEEVIIVNDMDDSGRLEESITAVLTKQNVKNKPSFSFVDDALKNAGLNITIQ
ncbi:MAG: hypothetical protein ACM3H8_02835 [Sphingobacteriales bacterium]